MKTNSSTKTPIRFITLLCAATGSLLILSPPAQAGYIVTLEQVGANVVASGSGAIDLSGLSLNAFASNPVGMWPSQGLIDTGNDGFPQRFYTGFTGPVGFGGGGLTYATGSGDSVGIFGSFQLLFVPLDYASDAPLSSSATWTNATFSSLGADPGTYEWTWGNGVDQNFTLQIGPVGVVPDSGSTCGLLFLALLGLLGATRLRFLHCPSSQCNPNLTPRNPQDYWKSWFQVVRGSC